MLLARGLAASLSWTSASALCYRPSVATAAPHRCAKLASAGGLSGSSSITCLLTAEQAHEQHRRQRRSTFLYRGGSCRTHTLRASQPRRSTSSSSSRRASSSSPSEQHEGLLVPQGGGGSGGSGGSGGGSGVSGSRRAKPKSTLGVAHHVLEQTVVPGLAGAVLKESPSDFVVVEIPQNAGSRFTPADPDEPVPKEARKPIVHKIPPVDTVMAAIKEWRERQLTGAAYQGPEVIPQDEAEQMPWNLAKGFDVVTEQLGAPATAQFQDWLLQVATRVAFDVKEEEEEEKQSGVSGPIDVLLPPPEPPRQVVLECPPSLDKAGRTEVHGAFRNHMAYFSTTAIMPSARPRMAGGGDEFGAPPPIVPNDGKVYLEVSFEKRKSRASWPKGRGEYLEFSLYKAGRSTSEVAEALCQRLHIKRARLSYAGAKDRRALTAQKMRCWRLPAETIHEAHADGLLSQDGLAISDYRYVETDLSLGGLKGNHFDVLLRPPSGGWGRGEAAREAAAAAAAARGGGGVSAAESFRRIRDEGFVNFFGEQRFGRDGTNNLDVGLLLLEGDWAGAIDRIMAPHPADSAMVAEAKEAFFGGRDYGYSMSLLPRTAFVERKILRALRDVESDPLAALLELPPEVRLLFVQAYQSLLWNRAASRRMGGEFDTRMAVEGDLVLVKGGKPLTAWETRPDDSNKNKNKENASSLYHGGPTGDSSGAAAGWGRGARGGDRDGREQQGGGRGGVGQEEVVRVTAEVARAGVFTIKHVVLPLPGNSVMFPLNSVGEEMLMSLKQDGVDDVILNGHPQKAFDLEGAYRHVMVHPRDFDVKPEPPAAVEEEGPDSPGIDAEVAADRARAEEIGAVRGPRGGMPAPITAAWLRARFCAEVKRRFKGASGGGGGGSVGRGETAVAVAGGDEGGGNITPIRVSFSLPLGAYATTLLQHVTGEGLDGRKKAWHTGGRGGGGGDYEGGGDEEGDHERAGLL